MTLPVPEWIEERRRFERRIQRLAERGPECDQELSFGPVVVCVLVLVFAMVVCGLPP